MSFAELGVDSATSKTLARQGITTPNAVQEETIPILMEGTDAVIQAPTGSGKTLAFVLPMLERLATTSSAQGPRALIVGPTRELAVQIASVITGLAPNVPVALLYGGVSYHGQLTALRRRAAIVVGCPGRIIDLARQGTLKLNNIEVLVLDEADEMLDQGFAPDVEKIIGLTPSSRQTVLASATMPEWVQTMVRKHLRSPRHVAVHRDVEPDLEHGLLSVPRQHKLDTLHRLLHAHQGQAIVFHRTKHGTKKLARDLDRLGHFVCELQGNLSQNARDRSISSFRRGDANVLVATNVAARGIDVSGVSLVVNFELPDTPQWLTHRIGRTARNGESGRAITFLSEDDGPTWKKLRKLGAPRLHHLDSDRLLERQEWMLLSTEPDLFLSGSQHRPPSPPTIRREIRTETGRPSPHSTFRRPERAAERPERYPGRSVKSSRQPDRERSDSRRETRGGGGNAGAASGGSRGRSKSWPRRGRQRSSFGQGSGAAASRPAGAQPKL